MVTDGKENFRSSSPILHDSPIESGTKLKSNILGNNQTTASRPLLFSEILFNNGSGNHFSTSCTSPIRSTSPILDMR